MDDKLMDMWEKHLNERHAETMRGIGGINARLDVLNSRVQKSENHIAVLRWAYAVGTAVVGWVMFKLTGQVGGS